jgi:hypothetical protein
MSEPDAKSYLFIVDGRQYKLLEWHGDPDVTVSVGGEFMGSFNKKTLKNESTGGARAHQAVDVARGWWAAK